MIQHAITSWKMNYQEYGNLDCTTPCSLYSVLLDNRLIEDPFYRDNEYEITKLSEQECEFSAVFTVSEAIISSEFKYIRFQGLDTLCDVEMNGKLLGHANNMHRVWEYNITRILVPGENKIRLRFQSPIGYGDRMQKKHYIWNTDNAMNGIGHIRKASCMFGWDWGPKLPDMGIFRSVEIVAFDAARIEDLLIRQNHMNGDVVLDVSLKTTEIGDSITAKVEITAPDKTVFLAEICNGKACVAVTNPELWWPNGLGSQPLYRVKVMLLKGDVLLDAAERMIGLRTMEVSTEPDRWGSEFCFKVNGIKVFSKGADYIPEDNLLPRITQERTDALIRDCAKANHNSIRVWGGGYYPEDWFYDACDRYGIIVWQDFMFACMNVWLSEPFEENIKSEFIDNLKRIRHHASLGLLCGNNEMELGVKEWGVGNSDLVKADYLRLYERILPDLCEEYAPDTFYWPASPSSGGGFDDPNNENCGDVHYWETWHGNVPFESYRKHYYRYCSEFGFESFPNRKTIESFSLPEDRNAFSKVMESHQKCKSGNIKMLTYAADKYLYANDFNRFVYTSQILQADAIRYGVEHFRRYRGRCMGAIYWQLNDCWPTASWSSIDYYGRWKALHYASKRFFANVLLTAHEEGTNVVFNLSNEQRSPFSGSIRYAVRNSDFKVIFEETVEVSVDAMSSKDIITKEFKQYFDGHEEERFLTFSLLDADHSVDSDSSMIFTKPKYFHFRDPEIAVDITGGQGSFVITLTGKAYAKFVEIDFTSTDVQLSDNYFDITSEEPIMLLAETPNVDITADELKHQLLIQSVVDISN